jgi:hypothetical protein
MKSIDTNDTKAGSDQVILTFVEDILGFENIKSYKLLPAGDDSPFFFLRAVKLLLRSFFTGQRPGKINVSLYKIVKGVKIPRALALGMTKWDAEMVPENQVLGAA